MFIYYLIFVLITLYALIDFYLLEKYNIIKNRKIFFILISFFLIGLSGARGIGVGVDDLNYQKMFLLAKADLKHKEIAIFLLAKLLNNVHLVFFVFAFIGIGLKVFLIYKTGKYIGILILIYFSSYYFLHDMVQIRAGIVSGLGLWSLYFAGQRKLKVFIFLITIGLLFHYAIIAFVPLYFLSKKKSRWFYVLLLSLALVLAFWVPLNIKEVINFLPSFLSDRVSFFLEKNYGEINLINPIAIVHYFIAITVLIYWPIIVNFSSWSIYIAKTYLLGIYVLLIFNFFPPIGFRIYELLLITQIPLLDIFLNVFRPKWLIAIFIISLVAMYFFFYIIYDPIVKPYFLF